MPHTCVQLEGLRPDAWTLRLLMFAALNAPTEAQFDLLTRVLADSRKVGHAMHKSNFDECVMLLPYIVYCTVCPLVALRGIAPLQIASHYH